MKNAHTVGSKIERKIRLFVRDQFDARIAKVGSDFQCSATKNSARVIIRNPNRVMTTLQEKFGKPASEKGHTTVFKIPKTGTVALTVTGDTSVLTLINLH